MLLATVGFDLPSGEDTEVDASAADSETLPLTTEAPDGIDADDGIDDENGENEEIVTLLVSFISLTDVIIILLLYLVEVFIVLSCL